MLKFSRDIDRNLFAPVYAKRIVNRYKFTAVYGFTLCQLNDRICFG